MRGSELGSVRFWDLINRKGVNRQRKFPPIQGSEAGGGHQLHV